MLLYELLKALLFGVVEGITEWLPVSSTGHMLLLNEFLSLDLSEKFYEVFEVVIQLGAVFAVAVKYRERLSPFGKEGQQRREIFGLWRVIFIGVLPSAIVGLLFDDVIEEIFYTPTVVALALIFYGIAFILAERALRRRRTAIAQLAEIDGKRAALVGLFQTLALIPGTSRSGATIFGAYICGASRSLAAEFSFLLAIPTMLGAGLLRSLKFLVEGNRLTNTELLILATGTVAAYIVSRITVDFLTELVKKRGFFMFGIYRIILGGLLLFYFWGRA